MTSTTGIIDLENKLSLIQKYINVNSNTSVVKMIDNTNITEKELKEISKLIMEYPCSFSDNDKFIIEEGRCINLKKESINTSNYILENKLKKTEKENENLKKRIKLLELYIKNNGL
tara:strand:+ start:2524 stop:2871 length:348 start_codon:yes stop_codon:yes gene_type:complete